MTEIIGVIESDRLPELMDLFAGAWWASDRTRDDVERMLTQSDLVVGIVADGVLAAFARVLTDFAYVALILDVVVAEDRRGTGLGRRLMDAVVHHDRLAGVRSLELVCQPELIGFYARWGFTDRVGRSLLMRRPGP